MPGSLALTILAGQVITGASVSFTVTVKLQVADPQVLVAVTVTVVVPSGNKLPDGTE
jgi:hypothetical protein